MNSTEQEQKLQQTTEETPAETTTEAIEGTPEETNAGLPDKQTKGKKEKAGKMRKAARKEPAELTAQERLAIKKKKKKKKTTLIVVLSVVGAVFLSIVGLVVYANHKMKSMLSGTVTLGTATRGTLTSELTISGIIESEKTIHYFAPANLLISDCLPTGSFVKKGDTVLSFDADSYARELRTAEINKQISENNYQSSEAKIEDADNRLSAARSKVYKYTQLVTAQQQVVDQLTADVSDNKAYQSAEIQGSINYYQQVLSDYQYNNKEKLSELTAIGYEQTEDDKKWIKEYNDTVYQLQSTITGLSNQLNMLSMSAEAYNNQKALNDASSLLAEYKAEKQSAEAEVRSLEGTVTNSFDRENLDLNDELAEMQNDKTYENLIEFENGLVAPFDGVITVLNYTKDDTTTAATPLATLSSLDDLHVNIGVNKSDLESIALGQPAVIKMLGREYKGKVEMINRVVTTNSNGSSQVAVTVGIDDPDDDMFLGLEVKCTITTACIEDCLQVPVEAVNVDNIGEFVFTIDPTTFIIGKKYVETGASSDLFIEIKSGIDESDIIVTTYSGTITEGSPAMVSPESMDYITAAAAKLQEEQSEKAQEEQAKVQSDGQSEEQTDNKSENKTEEQQSEEQQSEGQ